MSTDARTTYALHVELLTKQAREGDQYAFSALVSAAVVTTKIVFGRNPACCVYAT